MSTKSREEKTKQIRRIIEEIKSDDLSVGSFSDSDISDLSIEGDGLSDVSDISSLASFVLTPPKKKYKKENHQSRIPVLKGQKMKVKREEGPKLSLAKDYQPVFKAAPTNFLAPNLSEYAKLAICVFEGCDFPRTRFGERNTYVVVNVHRDLEMVLKSPICFNRTTNAVYNAGFDIDVGGLDFSSVVPIIEVFDFMNQDKSELIGLGYIQLQMAKQISNTCVILDNEWVDIVTVNTRTLCGRVKMSMIFHNEDTDVTSMIREQIEQSSRKEETNERKKEQKKPNSTSDDSDEKEAVRTRADDLISTSAPYSMEKIGELSLTIQSPVTPVRTCCQETKTRIQVKPPPMLRETRYATEQDLEDFPIRASVDSSQEETYSSEETEPVSRRKDVVRETSNLRDRFKGYATYYGDCYSTRPK